MPESNTHFVDEQEKRLWNAVSKSVQNALSDDGGRWHISVWRREGQPTVSWVNLDWHSQCHDSKYTRFAVCLGELATVSDADLTTKLRQILQLAAEDAGDLHSARIEEEMAGSRSEDELIVTTELEAMCVQLAEALTYLLRNKKLTDRNVRYRNLVGEAITLCEKALNKQQ